MDTLNVLINGQGYASPSPIVGIVSPVGCQNGGNQKQPRQTMENSEEERLIGTGRGNLLDHRLSELDLRLNPVPLLPKRETG